MMLILLMVACGLMAHFMKDLIRLKAEGSVLTPVQYWSKFPYKTVLCVIGAVVGTVALNAAGELTPVTGFGVGYMSNSVADILGKRAGGKI